MARNKGKGRARQKSGGKTWLLWGGLAGVIAAVLLLVAVSRAGLGADGVPEPSLERRIEAPDFQLTLYQGADVLGSDQLQFSDAFGQGKPVVLNFYAGLCPPCRAEMPDFQKVYDASGQPFILLGLDIGPFIGLGSNDDGRRLLQELNITYPAGTTPQAGTVSAYNVLGMPTTVFLTSDGSIFETHVGFLDEATLQDKVAALLAASGGS